RGFAVLFVTTIHVPMALPPANAERNVARNAEGVSATMFSYSLGKSSQVRRLVRSSKFLLSLLLGTSLGLNVLLARRVRLLRAMTEGRSSHEQLQVGTLIPPIIAKDLDGR